MYHYIINTILSCTYLNDSSCVILGLSRLKYTVPLSCSYPSSCIKLLSPYPVLSPVSFFCASLCTVYRASVSGSYPSSFIRLLSPDPVFSSCSCPSSCIQNLSPNPVFLSQLLCTAPLSRSYYGLCIVYR